MRLIETLVLLTFLTTGEVTYYRDGLMDRVRENRGLPSCTECVGMVCIGRPWGPSLIGRQVYLQRPGARLEGPFQVVDTGTFITPGRVAEVEARTARAWWAGVARSTMDVRIWLVADVVTPEPPQPTPTPAATDGPDRSERHFKAEVKEGCDGHCQ